MHRVTYLIEIEQSRPGGDFEGNDLPESMKPMTALQLQRAIAYDLVRIRTADLDPFESAHSVSAHGYTQVIRSVSKTHRPEFG